MLFWVNILLTSALLGLRQTASTLLLNASHKHGVCLGYFRVDYRLRRASASAAGGPAPGAGHGAERKARGGTRRLTPANAPPALQEPAAADAGEGAGAPNKGRCLPSLLESS